MWLSLSLPEEAVMAPPLFAGSFPNRLKDEGLLTRDARAKERKKYGMAGARKRFQFSKR